MKIILEGFVDHEFSDRPGLIVQGMGETAGVRGAFNSTTLTHDIVEHQNGARNIGTVEDELEAIGAIWVTRGQWGDFAHSGSGIDVLAAELSDLSYTLSSYDDQLKFKRYDHPWRLGQFGEEFSQALAVGKDLASFEDIDLECPHQVAFWSDAIPYMQLGARKALKRYGSGIWANTIFNRVREALEAPFRWLEGEHQRFVLDLNIKRGTAFCEEPDLG